MDFIGGSGSATVVGQAGSDTVSGGSGPLDIFTGRNETLSASGGSGGTTLFGASGADMNYTGSTGSLLFVAGVGNDTLNASGSSTENAYWAAIGTPAGNSLVGGSGDNTFAAGTGPDTFSGGAADNAYVFISSILGSSAQTDVISNFLTGTSSLVLSGGVSTVSASTGGSGAGAFTTLTLSDNTQITFLGVNSASQLTGHVFTN
jgi:Ca2+-binding RTX toxin-like protein